MGDLILTRSLWLAGSCAGFAWLAASGLDPQGAARHRAQGLASGPRAAPRRAAATARWPLAASLVGAAGVQVVVGGVVGLVAGLAVVAASVVALRHGAARSSSAGASADLALALDLLAAALASGAPLGRAAEVVGSAVGGEVGPALAAVSRVLRLGGDPARAFAPLLADDRLAPLGRALIRTAESGAGVAALAEGLAADVRYARAAAAEEAAQRAGVLAVLPLGLCFLPAFLILGIVPVVAGLAQSILRTLT